MCSRIIAIVILTLGALTAPARADLVYSVVGPLTVSAGDTNDVLDVLLTNTGTSDAAVGGFAFQVLTTDTDISFTSADTGSPNYIFPSDSFDSDFGVTLNTPTEIPLPQLLNASDLADDLVNATLAPGQSLSLGEVFFNVASNAAPGPFTVGFGCMVYYDSTVIPPNGEVVSQPLADCNNLAYYDPNSEYGSDSLNVDDYTSATITVVPAAGPTVPEPSSILLALGGLLALAAAKLARNRAAQR